jgi:hypothetical protein
MEATPAKRDIHLAQHGRSVTKKTVLKHSFRKRMRNRRPITRQRGQQDRRQMIHWHHAKPIQEWNDSRVILRLHFRNGKPYAIQRLATFATGIWSPALLYRGTFFTWAMHSTTRCLHPAQHHAKRTMVGRNHPRNHHQPRNQWADGSMKFVRAHDTTCNTHDTLNQIQSMPPRSHVSRIKDFRNSAATAAGPLPKSLLNSRLNCDALS